MRETPYRDGDTELVAIDSSGLVRAIADALAEHWPNRLDIDERVRQLRSTQATILRRGWNAAGAAVLSAASVEMTQHQGRAAYSVRGFRRKLHLIDNVVLDVLPGWDREEDFISAIREHALDAMPDDVRELTDPTQACTPGAVLWGTLRLRDGSERPGATWRIEQYDEGFDTVRGLYTTPTSQHPKPLSARGADLSAWAVGIVPAA